jgi:hypothetical protein
MSTRERFARLACAASILLATSAGTAIAAPRTVVVENWTNFQ